MCQFDKYIQSGNPVTYGLPTQDKLLAAASRAAKKGAITRNVVTITTPGKNQSEHRSINRYRPRRKQR